MPKKKATRKKAARRRVSERTKTTVKSTENSSQSKLTQEVLILLPWDWTRPYFSRLVQNCENAIADIEGVRPIIRCLHRDPGLDLEEEVTAILDRELKWVDRSRLLALVVAPTGAKPLERSIALFCAGEPGDVAVVPISLSLPFHHRIVFKHHGAPDPIDVWIHARTRCEKLGHESARRFMLATPQATVVKFLCAPGTSERIDSIERLEGFEAGLRHEIASRTDSKVGVQKLLATPCRWNRDTTRNEVTRILDESGVPDIIFCASDQMGLGARDAVMSFRNLPNTHAVNELAIYGFDGIQQVLELLDDENEPYMRGTIRQAIPVIALELKRLIAHLSRDEPLRPRPLTSADLKLWKMFETPPQPNHATVP